MNVRAGTWEVFVCWAQELPWERKGGERHVGGLNVVAISFQTGDGF